MTKTLRYDILTPFGVVARGECEMFVAPITTGEHGFLAGHTPYLAALGIGVARATTGDTETRIFISGGFIEFLDNKIMVLAETGETGDRIDVERARAALSRADEMIAQPGGEGPWEVAHEMRRARRAHERAVARLKAAGAPTTGRATG